MFATIGHIVLLAFGFGFVIFWHELGHFLAAKWADVRVEQFAVGFGQAIFSWRKGLGFRWGSTQKDYRAKLIEQVYKTQGGTAAAGMAAAGEAAGGRGEVINYSAAGSADFAADSDLPLAKTPVLEPTDAQLLIAAAQLPISETEYRLNWIPLGGYVKMMGQDDLKPGVVANDPRSYTNKPVGKRMVIVSAGVVMNVILAAVLFAYIFTVGFEVTKPVVGGVLAGSPASQTYKIGPDGKRIPAPLQTGDTILKLNGRAQSDYEKIALNTNLSIADESIPMEVQRAGTGVVETVYITPRKSKPDAQFPQIGVEQYRTLKAPPVPDKPDPAQDKLLADDKTRMLPEDFQLSPGDEIIAADGKPVKDFRELSMIQQAGQGNDLAVTVKHASGKAEVIKMPSHFAGTFAGAGSLSIDGMEMLTTIDSLTDNSPAIGKLKPGDIVVAIADAGAGGKRLAYPTSKQLLDFIKQAGEQKSEITFTVLRDGTEVAASMTPSIAIDPTSPHKLGIGIGLGMADGYPVLADVEAGSPAAAAGLPAGAMITAVNGRPVANWLQIAAALKNLKAGESFKLTATVGKASKVFDFKGLTQEQCDSLESLQYTSNSLGDLMPDTTIRKVPTGHVWTAAWWGAGETRDAILQVYLTIRSMTKGSISPTQVSGPVGILSMGYKIAERGNTRLIWFLAIISANLAVMNFLPIPIVDGGLFTFLIIEKIKGGPVSQRVQVAAQYVGLALLLCVFVFATYQDIYRLPFLFHRG